MRTDTCEETCPDSRLNTLKNLIDFVSGLEDCIRGVRQDIEKEVGEIIAERVRREACE